VIDPGLRTVLLGSGVLGLISGVLGTFAVLRRQSLLGDALAHAALPGVCIAFAVGLGIGADPKHPALLLAGAMATAWLGTLLVLALTRHAGLKSDAAIGIVLSVFFGVGIALLTAIQRGSAGAAQAGLDKFLFGQASSLVARDVEVMAALGAVVLVVVVVLYRPLQLLTFDPHYAASRGLPVRTLEVVLTSLLVIAVVVGLQTVGVVLMAALVVTPAAAARQWTDRLGTMVVLSGVLGMLAGVVGALASSLAPRLPTGPVVVLAATLILVVSVTLSPRRGLLQAALRRARNRRRIQIDHLLKDLWRLGEADEDTRAPRSPAEIAAVRAFSRRTMETARRQGLVESHPEGIGLTEEGCRRAARVVRNHRLWESYLSHRLELADDHLHRDAEDMEHVLEDDVLDRIDEALGRPELDPHGRPIPREASC
jgi:manganese/zinc/iron transport system permease protein